MCQHTEMKHTCRSFTLNSSMAPCCLGKQPNCWAQHSRPSVTWPHLPLQSPAWPSIHTEPLHRNVHCRYSVPLPLTAMPFPAIFTNRLLPLLPVRPLSSREPSPIAPPPAPSSQPSSMTAGFLACSPKHLEEQSHVEYYSGSFLGLGSGSQ